MKKFSVALALVVLGGSLPNTAYSTSGSPAPSPYVWKSVAIGGGGYVLDVYCHPKQRDLVYIRTDVGGFYRWNAASQTWTPLTDHFGPDKSNYYGGEGLALDPSDPNVVYIAAGKYTWDTPGTIFKSIDQGRTWKKLPIDLKMGGNEDHRWGGQRLVVSPFHSSVLLFGSRKDGLWRSSDAGASWSKVTTFPGKLGPFGITAIAFGEKTPGTIYAAAFGDGIYESNDDGLNWRATTGSPADVARLADGPDGALYATHKRGVSKYAAGQWTDITPVAVQGGFGGVTIDPRDPQDVLVAAQTDHLRLFRSRNGGTTWTEKKDTVESCPPWYSQGMKKVQYVAGVAFDPCVPGRVWLTDWYATYETTNIDADPIALRSHEYGHEELVVFTLSAPPTGLPLISGTADVDGFPHESLDTFPAHGLGDYYGGKGPTFGYTEGIAWCPIAPNRLARAGVNPWNNTGGVAFSQDGGRSWTSSSGWDAKIMASRIAISATDPDNVVVLRVHSGPAQATHDGGKTWQNVSGLPASIIGDVWNWQIPLAADGVAGSSFYVQSGGKLYKSTDGGVTFDLETSGLPNSSQSLVTVPGQKGDLWLAAGDSGLHHSTDGGLTFRKMPGVERALLFAAGKRAPGASYAALYLDGALTDGRKGIFRSLDAGLSWQSIGDARNPIGDVPNSITASFQTFGLVFIGTNGRGIYYGSPETRKEIAAHSKQKD